MFSRIVVDIKEPTSFDFEEVTFSRVSSGGNLTTDSVRLFHLIPLPR